MYWIPFSLASCKELLQEKCDEIERFFYISFQVETGVDLYALLRDVSG